MLFKIYNILWLILVPFAKIWLHYRVYKNLESKNRLSERYGFSRIKKPLGKIIWIHASSVGEAVSGIALTEGLRKEGYTGNILFTTFTLSASNYIKNYTNIIHQYIPLDHYNWVNNFLNHWQPDLAIMVESEIWPNLVLKSHAKKIPLIMASGQISQKSYKNWLKIGLSNSSRIFKSFDLIMAVDSYQVKIFKNLGGKNIRNIGSLKVSALMKKPDLTLIKKLTKVSKNKLVIVASSTHDGEEEIIINSIKKLLQNNIKLLLIIVPRHIQRGPEIIKKLKLNSKLRSSNEFPSRQDSFWVADSFGELNSFYSISDIVIVCGSFFSKGGHSPVEPCHFETSIIIGPNNFKNSETVSEMIKNNYLIKLKDNNVDTLSKVLLDLSENKHLQTKLSIASSKLVKNWKERKLSGAKLCLKLLK